MNFCNVLSVATLRCVNVFQQGRWNGPQLRCLNLTLEQTLPWGLRRSRHSQHKALSAPAYTFIIFGYRVASFAKHDGTLYKSPMTNWVKGKGMKHIFRKWKYPKWSVIGTVAPWCEWQQCHVAAVCPRSLIMPDARCQVPDARCQVGRLAPDTHSFLSFPAFTKPNTTIVRVIIINGDVLIEKYCTEDEANGTNRKHNSRECPDDINVFQSGDTLMIGDGDKTGQLRPTLPYLGSSPTPPF